MENSKSVSTIYKLYKFFDSCYVSNKLKHIEETRKKFSFSLSCIWVILFTILFIIDCRIVPIFNAIYLFTFIAIMLYVCSEQIDKYEYEIEIKMIEKIKKCIGRLYSICMFRTDTIDIKTIEDIVDDMLPLLNYMLVGSDCDTFKLELQMFLNDNLDCIEYIHDIDKSKLSNLIYKDIAISTRYNSTPSIDEEKFWNEMCYIYRDKNFMTEFIYYNPFIYDNHIINKLKEYYSIRTLDEEKRLLGRRYKWLHKHLISYPQTSKKSDEDKCEWVKNI